MSSVAAVYDRRPEKAGIRATWEAAGRICPAQTGRRPQDQASGNEQVSAGVRPSYSAKPLIKNHNVVPSFSPEGWRTLAGGNTPGNDSETLRPEGSPESIVGHPIRPISPIRPIRPHPKSTVDLRRKPLIKVENSLSPTRYRPKSGPKSKESFEPFGKRRKEFVPSDGTKAARPSERARASPT
jgi:hypothetical protein